MRKKINFNKAEWKLIDDLFESNCSIAETSASVGVSHDTLSNRIFELYKITAEEYKRIKKSKGNSALRKKQFDLAKEGDKSLLIWLGKQRLDQSDKKEIKQHNTGSLIKINMTGGSDEPIRTENDIKE